MLSRGLTAEADHLSVGICAPLPVLSPLIRRPAHPSPAAAHGRNQRHALVHTLPRSVHSLISPTPAFHISQRQRLGPSRPVAARRSLAATPSPRRSIVDPFFPAPATASACHPAPSPPTAPPVSCFWKRPLKWFWIRPFPPPGALRGWQSLCRRAGLHRSFRIQDHRPDRPPPGLRLSCVTSTIVSTRSPQGGHLAVQRRRAARPTLKRSSSTHLGCPPGAASATRCCGRPTAGGALPAPAPALEQRCEAGAPPFRRTDATF